MSDLPASKAVGFDQISARLLKASMPFTAASLTHIFNLAIESGIIPKDWKKARVTPIHKDDSRVDPSNYRPILILSVIAKLFVKIIFEQAYKYLNENHILDKFQSGFQPLHSTVTALLEATDQWYLNIDKELTNAVLFIDRKKAFDTIDHEILLAKLQSYGFRSRSVRLLRNYLSERVQVTEINGVQSEPRIVSHGVPQASILGPLSFLIYINDLTNYQLLPKVRMYADDTSLTCSSQNPDELSQALTQDLVVLKIWLDANRLSLNVIKTKCMFTGTRQKVSVHHTRSSAFMWTSPFLGIPIFQKYLKRLLKPLVPSGG